MKQTKQRGNLSASSVFIESFLSKWTEDVTTYKNDRSDIAIKGHRAYVSVYRLLGSCNNYNANRIVVLGHMLAQPLSNDVIPTQD